MNSGTNIANTTLLESENKTHDNSSAKNNRSSKNTGKYSGITVIAIICVGFIISASWLIFPYFVKDKNLLGDVGSDVKRAKLQQSITIGQFLTRSSFGSGEAQVDVLFATTKYFEVTDRARAVEEYRPDQHLVFFVTETTHIEELPTVLPTAVLKIDGKVIASVDIDGPKEVFHHRVSALRFPAFDENNQLIINDQTQNLELELTSQWDLDDSPRKFSWDLPIDYPAELETTTAWTPLLILGLSAGLLSFVLTPCLLQLLVVYMMTFTGVSAQQLQNNNTSLADKRRHMFSIGLVFVAGFVTLFMLTGGAIGYAGKEMQIFFAVWSSKISVFAGIAVILMGIWIGIRARAPIVCKLAPAKLTQHMDNDSVGYIPAAVIGIFFTLGCLTCFGGAIIATLLVYVGALGSAFIGAMVMLAFSVGVVVPFLLAAFFLSRMTPLLNQIERLAPKIGFVSMIVIIAFGLVLVTDNFHVVSDFIYPYLGLS